MSAERCIALTTKGARCKNKAAKGSDFCRVHLRTAGPPKAKPAKPKPPKPEPVQPKAKQKPEPKPEPKPQPKKAGTRDGPAIQVEEVARALMATGFFADRCPRPDTVFRVPSSLKPSRKVKDAVRREGRWTAKFEFADGDAALLARRDTGELGLVLTGSTRDADLLQFVSDAIAAEFMEVFEDEPPQLSCDWLDTLSAAWLELEDTPLSFAALINVLRTQMDEVQDFAGKNIVL
jgi:hypothetical protein